MYRQCIYTVVVTEDLMAEMFSKTAILISLSFIIFVVYEIFPKHDNIPFHIMESRRTRYILYWDTMWNLKDFLFGHGSEIFKNCPVDNCYATDDKHLMPVEKFDALFFHGVTYKQIKKNDPPKRDPNQIYVYFSMETPFNTENLTFSRRFFNWTVTYR